MLEGGFGRVPSLGSCLGHLPCVQRGQGATYWRAVLGLGIAACLRLPPHPAWLRISECVQWGFHLASQASLSSLHMGAQGTQEIPQCPLVW